MAIKTKAQLQIDIDALLTANGVKGITGVLLNTLVSDMVDSLTGVNSESSIIEDLGTITVSPQSVDIADGGTKKLIIDVDLTLNAVLGSLTNSSTMKVIIEQEGTTGGHSLTLGTNFLTSGGVAPVISTSAGSKDLLIFESGEDGKYILVEHRKSIA